MSPDAGTNVVDVYVNYLRKKLGAVSVEGRCGRFGDRDGAGRRLSDGWSRKMTARVSEYPAGVVFAGA